METEKEEKELLETINTILRKYNCKEVFCKRVKRDLLFLSEEDEIEEYFIKLRKFANKHNIKKTFLHFYIIYNIPSIPNIFSIIKDDFNEKDFEDIVKGHLDYCADFWKTMEKWFDLKFGRKEEKIGKSFDEVKAKDVVITPQERFCGNIEIKNLKEHKEKI